MSIIISPVGSFNAGDAYYNIPAEFPLDPLKTVLRWANYPWAYNTAPVITWAQPPS